MSEQVSYDPMMGCTFDEDVRSEPIPKGKYRAVVARLQLTDPVLEGWEARTPEDDMSPRVTVDFQITGTVEGLDTELKGRYLRRVRVDLRPGVNPKTGDAYRKVAADLLRAFHGLGPKGSVKGLVLFSPVPDRLSREEAAATVNKQLEGYVGLALGISVRNWAGDDGQQRDALGGIIVPEA